MLGYHPPARQTPPGKADAPLDQAPPNQAPPPQTRHPSDQALPQTRHPPGADTPTAVHAGRYGQQAGGMHPAGMQSCLKMLIL